MPEFEPPECDDGHESADMTFLESYDPMDQNSCGVGVDCTEWRQRWRYACPECERVVELRESIDGGFERTTVREGGQRESRDSTSLSPVRE